MSLQFLLPLRIDLLMVSLHQDMRSPRFAYKTEESHPDMVEVLAKHTFPLSHNLVSLIQTCSLMLDVYGVLCCKAFLHFIGVTRVTV